jgi:hypothetical protein
MGKPGRAGHVHSLSAQLVDATADDLINLARLETISFHELHEDLPEDVGRVNETQGAFLPPDGRSRRIDNYHFSHGLVSFLSR